MAPMSMSRRHLLAGAGALLVIAAVLGVFLNRDAEIRNEGSELLDLNV